MVFSPGSGYEDMQLKLPCGQCIGCRLERSRQWAVRCVHEASMHDENSFVTLTYDDGHLPQGGTLVKKDFQDFMKRLRFGIAPQRVRFYHAGEYGAESWRPHYHALLFGKAFADQKLFTQERGVELFTSEELQSYWPFGFCTVGAVTFESAAYCARYLLNKITGEAAKDHYLSCDPDTGEVFELEPEYSTMSRRPGIGRGWIDKYESDVYPFDEVIVRGVKSRPPRYYDVVYEAHQAQLMGRIKGQRKRNAARHEEDNTYDRLVVREQVKAAQISMLKRTV